MRQTTSERIAVGRFVLTAGLCWASVVIGGLSLIIPGMEPVSSSIVWPLVTLATTLAATVLWLLGQSWPARIPLFVSGVIVGLFVVIPAHPKIDGAGRVAESTSEVTSALAAQDATTWDQGVLFVCIAAACVCSCGRTRSPLPRVGKADASPAARLGGRTEIVAAVVLALVLGAAIPAGFGLHSLNQTAMRARAETSTHYDPPKTDKLDTDVTIGKKHGWSRTGLDTVLPAGKITIGVRANTVVGLRTRDGAKLWQYQIKHHDDRNAISSVVVDTDARTVLVQFRDALIGIGFGGKTRYHTKLPHTGHWMAPWKLMGTPERSSSRKTTLSRGATAVFARGGGASSASGPAKGISVATGHRLWRTNTDESCNVGASTRGKTAHVLITGKPPCRTRLLRFDGTKRSHATKLKPPHKFGSPAEVRSHPDGVPRIRIVDDSIAVIRVKWTGSEHVVQTTTLVDSTGSIRTSRAEHVPGPLYPFTSKGDHPRLGTLDTHSTSDQPAWMIYDHKLRRQSVISHTGLSKISEGSLTHKPRRVGNYLNVADFNGKLHIRRIDHNLTEVETIDATKLSRCRSHRKMSGGDHNHLALSCDNTVYVRPIS